MSNPARIGLGLINQMGPRTGTELFEARIGCRLVCALDDLEWDVFTRGYLPPEWEPTARARIVECAPRRRIRGGRLVAEQVSWPHRLRASRPDLLVVLAFGFPLLYRGSVLLAVHDLGPLRRPGDFPLVARTYWTTVFRRLVPRCRRLVTPSEWVRRDCAEWLGFPEDRIDVVPNGVESHFFASDDGREELATGGRNWLRERGVEGPVWLHCGSVYPRKNLQVVVRAASILRARDLDVPAIVSVGGGGPHAEALRALAQSLGVSDRLHFAGRQSDDVLRALYAACDAFVFPSWIEGFGVPPLEAMAGGASVMAARATCLPEILGDASEWADPAEPESWIEAWDRLRGENPEQRSSRLRRGQDRARLYNWADATLRAGAAVRKALETT